MEHWVWVTVGALFIWSIFGIGGFIENGGMHGGVTEPFIHYQSMSGYFGFVAAGIFLVFFYPVVGFAIGGIGLILFLLSCIKYLHWKKKNMRGKQS